MRKFNLSAITSTIGFPPKQGSWIFIIESFREVISAMIISEIGNNYDSTKVYVLYGCVATVGGSNTTITEGAVFTNGEVFLSPVQSVVNASGGNVIVLNLLTNQFVVNADPVVCTDLVSRNLHDIRTAQYNSSGASGTGNLNGSASVNNDYSSLVFLNENIISGVSLSGYVVSFERSKTIIANGSGTLSFSLTNVGAKIGSEITIIVSGTVPVPALTDGAGTGWNIATFNYSTGGYGVVAIKLKYLGNASSIDYCTYEVKGYNPPL